MRIALESLALPTSGLANHSDNHSFIVLVGITSSLQWAQNRIDSEEGRKRKQTNNLMAQVFGSAISYIEINKNGDQER